MPIRHTRDQGHHPSCLLAARCRFGGSYPHFEAELPRMPNVNERLLCYQLRIGIAEIYQNAFEGNITAL